MCSFMLVSYTTISKEEIWNIDNDKRDFKKLSLKKLEFIFRGISMLKNRFTYVHPVED